MLYYILEQCYIVDNYVFYEYYAICTLYLYAAIYCDGFIYYTISIVLIRNIMCCVLLCPIALCHVICYYYTQGYWPSTQFTCPLDYFKQTVQAKVNLGGSYINVGPGGTNMTSVVLLYLWNLLNNFKKWLSTVKNMYLYRRPHFIRWVIVTCSTDAVWHGCKCSETRCMMTTQFIAFCQQSIFPYKTVTYKNIIIWLNLQSPIKAIA